MIRFIRQLLLASTVLALSLPALASTKVEMQTSAGRIVIELDAAKAPATVANFLQYAKEGFYDGTIFHRVIPGFMIQGGGFDRDMQQKATRAPVRNEADNGLKNKRYTIAMARTNDPHSATAQFFINVADNEFLNFTTPNGGGWGYAVFGKVAQGTEVVDKIVRVNTGNRGIHQNVPIEPIIIQSVKVLSDK